MNTFTKPEWFVEAMERRQLTGKVLENPCVYCKNSERVFEVVGCSIDIARRWKDCAADNKQPKFEPSERAIEELKK